MGSSSVDTVAVLAVIALSIFLFLATRKRSPRRDADTDHQSSEPNGATKSSKKAYVLKTPSTALVQMSEPTSRLFTYKDERQAAKARQRLWMRYQDRQGHITERTVEIYQPENDEVIFAWCCMARAPRTFARRSIQSWQLMPDTFVFDPIINQYWEEEGTRDMSEKLPWRRWLEQQPDSIADRYQ